jgi:hypothetical protein
VSNDVILRKDGKEAAMLCFKGLSRNMAGGTEGNHGNRIISIPDDILSEHLPN